MKVKFVPCRSYAVGFLLQTSRQTPADNVGLKRMGGRLLRPVCRSCGGATVGDLCRKCSGPVPRVTSLNRRSLMLGGIMEESLQCSSGTAQSLEHWGLWAWCLSGGARARGATEGTPEPQTRSCGLRTAHLSAMGLNTACSFQTHPLFPRVLCACILHRVVPHSYISMKDP